MNTKEKKVKILYGKEMIEPELRPEFITELLEAQKEKTVKIKNFSLHYSRN